MGTHRNGWRTWTLLALVLFAAVAAGCGDNAPIEPSRVTPQDGGVLPPLSPACKSDSECRGKRCDPLNGCVDCLFDSQCSKGSQCTAGKCESKITCTSAKDCAAPDAGAGTSKTPACDVFAHECVRCVVDMDCAKNEFCSEHQCQPFTPCVNTLDCPSDKVCNRMLGRCVGCVTGADCGDANAMCVESTCVASCVSDKECASLGRLCDVKAGHCVQCVQQVDCPGVYHCAAGKCILDVCAKDERRCDFSRMGLETCNAVGDGYDLEPCPLGSSCTETSGKSSCKTWLCQPDGVACDAEHKKLQTCSADGLSVAKETDCAAMGLVCSVDACRPKICEPKSFFCKGQVSNQCSDDGTSASVSQTCGVTTYCDAATGTCKLQACAPGSKVCDGSTVTTCADDGSGPMPGGTDCAASSTRCFAGECKPKLCEPDSTYCKGTEIYTCADNGTREALKTRCSVGYYCDATLTPPSCHVGVCTANAAVCNGNEATTCKPDGSGYQPGTDCTATNQVCWTGKCMPKVCEPNSYYCKSGNVYQCLSNGSSESVYRVCVAGTYCDATLVPPVCATNKCTANGPACNGNIATTCNADGSGYQPGGTDCTTSGKVCVSGSCLPKICTPNAYFCSGGNVQLCGPTGATSTLVATCAASQFCSDGVSYCQTDVCTAGQPTCNGDLVSTCKPDGSGPMPGGMDCTVNQQVCDGGACKPVVCMADKYFCSGGNVNKCNAKGTASTVSSYCDVSQYCDKNADPAVCKFDICIANTNVCAGETLAVCNADGSGYASMSTNCSSSSQVCALSPGPVCAATAVETYGGNTSTTSLNAGLLGTYVNVATARKLTQIEAYYAPSGTALFTWVVYSSTTQTGTYSKIFEVTTSGSGTMFHSSGPINVSLEKGKFYFIGVLANGAVGYYQYTFSVPNPGLFSFGQGLTGASYAASTTPATVTYPFSSTYNSYYQRYTTALP
jgi:hypothetical protein